jgi:hypothetical protein
MNFPCVKGIASIRWLISILKRFARVIHMWARLVRTWLPFHRLYKRFIVRREGDEQVICTTVLMDEERIVFSTCPDVSLLKFNPRDRFLKKFH